MIIYSILALVCSVLYSVSAVLCKYGLQHNVNVRELGLRRLIGFLANNRLWILGVVLSLVANLSMIQIQSRLDVSIVYSILNFSYIFVLVLGHYFLNEHLNREQWYGVGVVVFGTMLILAIQDNTTGHPTHVPNLLILTGCSVFLIASLILTAVKNRKLNYEILFAISTGICFGCVETYLKATTNFVSMETGSFSIFSLDSMQEFVLCWPFFVMFLYGAAGWFFLQVTYSHGNVSVTVPLIAVTQRIMSMSSGYFVYGEYFSFLKVSGIITIIVGVFILILSTLSVNEPETI